MGDVDGTDSLFDNEPAKKAMAVFGRSAGYYLDESSCMEPVGVDGILSGKSNSFTITASDALNTDDESEVTKHETKPRLNKMRKE